MASSVKDNSNHLSLRSFSLDYTDESQSTVTNETISHDQTDKTERLVLLSQMQVLNAYF
jgi:hypothetical protein